LSCIQPDTRLLKVLELAGATVERDERGQPVRVDTEAGGGFFLGEDFVGVSEQDRVEMFSGERGGPMSHL